MRIKVDRLIFLLCESVFCVFILARPVAGIFTHDMIKYIFIFISILGLIISFLHARTMKVLGINYILLLLLWILCVFISALYNGGVELFMIAFEDFIFWMIPIILIPCFYKKIKWDNILIFLSYFGCVDSCVSFIEFTTNKVMFPIGNEKQMVMQYNGTIRTYGLNGSYFVLAEILCLCGLAALCLIKFKKKKIYLINFVIITMGVLSTGTRGYYVAYAVGVCFIMLSDISKRISINRIIVIVGLILFVLLGLYIVIFTDIINFKDNSLNLIIERIRNIFNWTGESANVVRVGIWKKSLELWKTKPLFGYGAGSTSLQYSKTLGVTESGFLKRLVEFGLVGTILQYATFFYPIFKNIGKIKKCNDPIIIFWCAFIISSIIEDSILQMFGGIEYTLLIWIALGYILSYVFYNRKLCILN